MKFLVVDDEKPAVDALSRILERVSEGAMIVTETHSDEALHKAIKFKPDVAFLDVEMPGDDGLTLAGKLKKLDPEIEIIMVTAYPQYSIPAIKLHVSDYLLKPVSDENVTDALGNLQRDNRHDKLKVHCFGNFEIFYNGKPIRFTRTRSKELLAYLVSRRGAGVTSGEICAALWEDDSNLILKKTYIRQYYSAIIKALEPYGMESALRHSRDSYSVNTELMDCDLYRFIDEKNLNSDLKLSYTTEIMSQYSWSEGLFAALYE